MCDARDNRYGYAGVQETSGVGTQDRRNETGPTREQAEEQISGYDEHANATENGRPIGKLQYNSVDTSI